MKERLLCNEGEVPEYLLRCEGSGNVDNLTETRPVLWVSYRGLKILARPTRAVYGIMC